MIRDIDHRLIWRALTDADLPEVASLREQIEAMDDPVLSAVEKVLGDGRFALLPDMGIGGWDAYGNLLAYGWTIVPFPDVPRVHLVGGVHPTHRHMGIGRELVAWQVESAVAWRDAHHPGADLWIGCYHEHGQLGLPRVLADLGFTRERYFYDMQRDDLTHLPRPVDLPGIEFTPYSADRSEELRRLHNLCFSDPEAGDGLSPMAWADSFVSGTFRPDWSWLALADGRVVGYALSGVDRADVPGVDGTGDDSIVLAGWTDRVGVDPAHRGRGISVGLLTRTLHSMAGAGCRAAGIGVDTTDAASPEVLSERLGYETRDGLVLMSTVVPGGVR